MAEPKKPIDVLIFEDDKSEVNKIIEWLGLGNRTVKTSKVFQRSKGQGGEADVVAQAGREWVKREVKRADPLLVVMDYLLSGPAGSEPFDGADYGNQLKEWWPKLGVILVTTGGSNISSQEELTKQHVIWKERAREQANANPPTRNNDAVVDYAWVKPWGEATDALPKRVAQPLVKDLIENRCLRPSEHEKPNADR